MTVYAPTDVQSITIPTDRGGCGQSHEAGELAPGRRFSIDCPACEPLIVGLRTGWAATPIGVHLTPDEIAEDEAAEALAIRERNRTWAQRGPAGGQDGPARTPSMLELFAAASADERAALAAMLNAQPAPVEPPPSTGDSDSDTATSPESSTDEPGATKARRPPAKKTAPPAAGE
jgi:hypothetical protein